MINKKSWHLCLILSLSSQGHYNLLISSKSLIDSKHKFLPVPKKDALSWFEISLHGSSFFHSYPKYLSFRPPHLLQHPLAKFRIIIAPCGVSWIHCPLLFPPTYKWQKYLISNLSFKPGKHHTNTYIPKTYTHTCINYDIYYILLDADSRLRIRLDHLPQFPQ